MLSPHRDRPVALLLSRQNLPVLAGTDDPANLARGAYILADAPNGQPDVILIGTGSEVAVALAARALLAERGVQARVVSMPSWELFEEQDKIYREAVLPPSVPRRVSVEAGVTLGWERYVGGHGSAVGINRFGESGKGPEVMAHLGITAENVANKALQILGLSGQDK